MLSDRKLADCRFSLTGFNGFYSTRPAVEIRDATWEQVRGCVAPLDSPTIVESKDAVLYVLPSGLKEGPLVGKTAERAIQEGLAPFGKMRSASHVTEAAILKYDLDGMTEKQWVAILSRLEASGLTFLAYTTHSHGRADKPGIRVRVWIPMDRALGQADYSLAWEGAASILFKEVVHG